MSKISKRIVDGATPQTVDYFIWDIEVKGFGLKVLTTGVKSYVFQYRTPEGRSRRATIGKHSETMTADQARAKAKRMRIMVDDGGDPLGDRQAARKALTVAQVLSLWCESKRFKERTAATQSNDQGRVTRHLNPTLGSKYIHKLTAEDVRRAFAAIRDGKTAVDVKTRPRGRAVVRGGEGAARMAIRVFRAALNWAITEGFTSSNPAHGVQIGTDDVRENVLDTPEQYAQMFRTIERLENEKRIQPAAADAIRVIALSGARRGEIIGLRCGYVDLKAGVLRLPPSAHKTGRKTGKPRVIGLPAAAQAIIAKNLKDDPDAFVFPPTKGEGAITLAKAWRLIRVTAELPDGIGLHGLRHSLASSMAMNGAEAAEIMTALGHRQLSTAQRYIHWAKDERAALAEKSAAHITGALIGNTAPGKVVKLGGKP